MVNPIFILDPSADVFWAIRLSFNRLVPILSLNTLYSKLAFAKNPFVRFTMGNKP